jgi:predicted amidohydrolase
MQIALYQFAPLWGNVTGNIDKIDAMLRLHPDVELWILPELATTGYLFANRAELMSLAEPFPGGRTGQWLSEVSRQLGMAIVSGVTEVNGGQLYNSAVLFYRGEQLAIYRKIHLFDEEKSLFDAGKASPPVVDVGGVKTGIMICFDWIFPEIVRTLALHGAQLIAHPANLVLPYCPAAMVTRSIENRVFTATANRIGTEKIIGKKELVFIGSSQVTDIHGMRLGRLSETEEAVLVVDIDPEQAKDKRITERNDLFRDRKPQLYFTG